MAKKSKQVVPFFQLRQQSEDTLQTVANELLMTIQIFTMLLRPESGLSPIARATVKERADALRQLCMGEEN